MGQSSRPRRSSRYSDRNVITLARSPVIPKMTKMSAGVAMPVSSPCSGLVRADADPARALVAEPRPGPIDHRLGPVLAGREQGEVDRTPGQPGGAALEGAPAAGLGDRRAAADGRHRPLVVIVERFGGLAGHPLRDAVGGVLPGLERDRAQLG